MLDEGFRDFIALIVPELQSRGRYKTAYRDGTLRDTVAFSILAAEWPALRSGLESKLAHYQEQHA